MFSATLALPGATVHCSRPLGTQERPALPGWLSGAHLSPAADGRRSGWAVVVPDARGSARACRRESDFVKAVEDRLQAALRMHVKAVEYRLRVLVRIR